MSDLAVIVIAVVALGGLAAAALRFRGMVEENQILIMDITRVTDMSLQQNKAHEKYKASVMREIDALREEIDRYENEILNDQSPGSIRRHIERMLSKEGGEN